MMASAIPKVAEVLKGSFDDSLKKLVQPASIVPATIFVLILLVTVYPALLGDENRIATAFEGFDDTWKVVAISGIVIVLGYVLLSLSGTIMRIATGESWRGTWLAEWLIASKRRSLPNLYARAAAAQRAGQMAEASRLYSDAAATPDDVMTAPTRLGQVLNGMSASVARRYGIDPAGLWSQMHAVLVVKDEHLSAQIDDDTAQLQVLLNLAAVVAVAAVMLLAFYLLRADWTAVLWVGLLLTIAYLLYLAAVPAARQYADSVESVFDLYRSDLATALKVTIPDDPGEARSKWQSLSASLLYDDDEAATALAPESKPSDPMTVKASSNVDTTILTTPITSTTEISDDETRATVDWTASYILIVTSKRRVKGSASVAVLDSRMKDAPATDEIPGDGGASGQPMPPGDDGAGVLWQFPNLRAREARTKTHSYSVGKLSVDVTGVRRISEVEGDLDEPGSGSLVVRLTQGAGPAGASRKVALRVRGSRFRKGDEWAILVKATGRLPKAHHVTVSDDGLGQVDVDPVRKPVTVTWFKPGGDG